MKVSNKSVYQDQFNSLYIHVIKSHRNWAQDMTPSCGLHSWAVDLSSQSNDEWRNQVQDTLTKTVFNKHSRMSTESHVSVPVDVCGCSSIDERERTEMRKTGNFLSILSNISCGYVVNMSTANDRGLPPYPLSFS